MRGSRKAGYARVVVAGLVVSLVAACGAPRPAAEPASSGASAWDEDLTYLVETLEQVHPNLYARIEREELQRRAGEIRAAIPESSDEEIVVALMQLLALVGDGHTSLEPVDPAGFGRWFPVRFYRFTDGVFITAITREHTSWAGAKVERIGGLSADEAWERSATLLGADNEFDALERASYYLSNAVALRALGVNETLDRLPLELRLADGTVTTVEIAAVEEEAFDLGFQFWGEIWGPASSEVEYVTAFDGRSADDHYDETSDLPLHLRYRSSFWFTYEPEQRLFYTQINAIGDSRRREETFAEFTASLWRAADAREIDFFVLDLRYNAGGDGSLVRDFVHELIRRPRVNRKGTFFTIVGRKTFSAAVMMARALEEHTETTFVGEPMGAYWRSYGDGTSFQLPHSGLEAWVSTIYHQLSSYAGDRRLLPIELPARFSSADYFGRRDPALERILASRRRPLLANVFREQGAAAALEVYERRFREYGGVDWWEAIGLRELGWLGQELGEADRWEDALAAHRLNARRHPGHWRVWWNLGRALQETGDREGAIASYEKALAVAPFNNLASFQRARLEELRRSP